MTVESRAGQRAIDISYADLRNVAAADVEAIVTDDDRGRLAAMARPGRRREYLAGRALIRVSLERWTGRPAASHRLLVGENGRPECAGGPTISIAHNGTLVACAVSSADAVGVDVQFPAPRVRAADIARQYFSAAESHWLRSAPDGAFYMLWVLKEAYLKALGRGLGGGLALLDCRVVPPRITATAAIRAELALYSAGNGFLGIASIGRGFPRIAVECWNPSPTVPVLQLQLLATTAQVSDVVPGRQGVRAGPKKTRRAD